MSTSTTVPVFDPQGVLRDIPEDQLAAAVKAGGMPAVKFQAPDSSIRFVPANRTQEAVQAGGKIQPFEQQDVKHPGFWATLTDDMAGMVKGLPQMLTQFSSDPATLSRNLAANSQRATGQVEGELADKRSASYMAAAVAASPFVNVPGMEESSRTGDVGGVMGHATAPMAATALTAGAAELGPRLADALSEPASKAAARLRDVTPKQAAQTVGATTGAGLGHGALSVPGAYYGAKGAGSLVESVLGKERANAPIFPRPIDPVYPGAPLPGDPGVFPGAPLPESPESALLQARNLSIGARPHVDPAAGLGQIPVAPRTPPPLPDAFQPRASYQEPAGTATNPFQGPVPGSAGSMAASVAEPPIAEPPEMPEPMRTTAAGDTIPRTLSGESALRQVLTGQDNANLMKIAKSRGINVSKESQLKPSVADKLLVNKIVEDFSDEELDNFRSTYLEHTRMRGEAGGIDRTQIGPEANKVLSLQTYFPDVKIPLTQQLRTRTAIGQAAAQAKNPVPATASTGEFAEAMKSVQKATKAAAKKAPQTSPAEDLTDILQKSLEAARAQKQ